MNPPRPRSSVPLTHRSQPGSALDCAAMLRALGEESRLRIVGLLFEGPLSVNDLAERAGLSQYNASRHLKILRDAGVLEMAPDGQQRIYSIAPSLRRRKSSMRVLDLGCCEFRFPEARDAGGAGLRDAVRRRGRSR